MNRKFSLTTALVAGLLPAAAFSQVSPAPPASSAAPAASPAAASIEPKAIPAKIALIAFQDAVVNTNEGMRAIEEVNKKYASKEKDIQDRNAEIDSLKKQLAAAPATMPADEKNSRARTIDTKEKQLQRDFDDTRQAYSTDQQEALSKVAQKVSVVLDSYAKQSGFTVVLDISSQASTVMWADDQTNITEAVVKAYNASTPSITAPPPSAPSAGAAPRPRTTTPSTTPRTPAKPQ